MDSMGFGEGNARSNLHSRMDYIERGAGNGGLEGVIKLMLVHFGLQGKVQKFWCRNGG